MARKAQEIIAMICSTSGYRFRPNFPTPEKSRRKISEDVSVVHDNNSDTTIRHDLFEGLLKAHQIRRRDHRSMASLHKMILWLLHKFIPLLDVSRIPLFGSFCFHDANQWNGPENIL